MQKLFCLLLFIVFVSCHSPRENNSDSIPYSDSTYATDSVAVASIDTAAEVKINIEYDTTLFQGLIKSTNIYDQYANYVAGVTTNDPKMKQYEELSGFKRYAHFMDSAWKSVEARRFSKMRQWTLTECVEANKTDRTVFYPFSGPDFVSVFSFFPRAKTYYMLALEPTGSYPKLEQMNEAFSNNYFSNFMESLDDIFNKSYFITRKMNTQLQSSRVDGILPLLTLFIKRTGHNIVDVKKVVIDSLGQEVEIAYEKNYTNKGRPRGVKVVFNSIKDTTDIRTVYYYSCDLVDPSFNPEKPFYKYLSNTLNDVTSYAKSASYIMHVSNFSNITKLVVNKSKFLLQDDTGAALHNFDLAHWDLQLYGKYVKPVSDFDYGYQTELKELYKKDSSKVKRLPFDLGYHWGTRDNNLMRFIRKANI